MLWNNRIERSCRTKRLPALCEPLFSVVETDIFVSFYKGGAELNTGSKVKKPATAMYTQTLKTKTRRQAT